MDVGFIPDITSNEVTALHGVGARTTDDLWAKVASREVTVDALSARTGIPVARLVDLLTRDAERFAETRAGGWATRHWLDLAVVGLVPILAWLVWRGLVRA
jgi:hypothetical protein